MGSTTGSVAGGTLEAGYQIGCGVEMDKVKLNGQLTVNPFTVRLHPDCGHALGFGNATAGINGQFEVEPRPGTITNVTVDKKSFKATSARITLKDIHVKIDNCVSPRRCARMRCSPVRAPTPTTSSPTTASPRCSDPAMDPHRRSFWHIGVTVAASGIFIAGATLLFANTAAAEPAGTRPRNRVTPPAGCRSRPRR